MVESASADEIRQAYKGLARRVHPDAGGNAEQMARVNEAFRVLSDPGRRAQYDAGRRPVATSGTFTAGPTGTAVDRDDDVDFEPSPPWKVRLPFWSMLVLGTLFAVFLFTAYAGSGKGPTTSVPAVDGVLTVGACVRQAADGSAEEVACASRRDGVVMQLVARDQTCPVGSGPMRRTDSDGWACVKPG